MSRIGRLEIAYSPRGLSTYRMEVFHEGLKKHRLIKSSESHIVERKAQLQAAEWDSTWEQVQSRERDRSEKQSQRQQLEANKQAAAERTIECQQELQNLSRILQHTLGVNDTIEWEELKDLLAYSEPKPLALRLPDKPVPKNKPQQPQIDAALYQPKFGLVDRIFASRREKRMAECRANFDRDLREWTVEVEAIDAANASAEQQYRAKTGEMQRQYEASVKSWEEKRRAYYAQQRLKNEAVDKRQEAYLSGSSDAVIEYADMVLSASHYPDYFPKEFNLDYNRETKILVVDYALPAPRDLPTLREVKFVQNRGEFAEQHLTQPQIDKVYDDLLYQVSLRTIHELFESDAIGALSTVVFNGFVTSIDPRSGQHVTGCILSLQVQRGEFMAINLANIDPRACFKALKGVGSSKLHSLIAVAPILQMRRDDRRFVAAQEVTANLQDDTNLAAMDWEDFEHLIREVFEKEFQASGGEVKVTQASRDGGVDAVAFDPDPIRGGKIVIQAKRYTHTVSVGAVRDLYGTVMNEGANKGILVSTSDFGPDAYAFAKGKPLMLLNGSNLLHMLEKHGHKVRIDLQEARRDAANRRPIA